MKRVHLTLDEELLKEARQLSGAKSYSRVVNRALAELVRRQKAGRILELAGSGLWKENLPEMRSDHGRETRRWRQG